MKEEKDVYIKDEGDFATVIFQSVEAVKIVKSQIPEEKLTIGKTLDDTEIIKLDIDVESVPQINTWLITHNLSCESEIPWIIKEKKN